MATITDGQAEIRSGDTAALIVGDGTDYIWSEEGPQWWGPSEVRTTDQPRSGADGYTPGRDLLGKHVSTVIVSMLGDSESDIGDKIDAWKAACAPSSGTLIAIRVNLLGRTRLRFGRFRIPGEANAALARSGYVAIGSAQFEVLDSRTYGDDLHQVVTGRVTSGSGFVPPFTPPFTLGASGSGAVAVVNAGNLVGPWTGRLDGPLTNPVVTHLESGNRLAFTANGGLTLDVGEWLDLESSVRSVLLGGTADRRLHLSLDSSWPELAVGTNTFELTADSGSGTFTVSWRDAWLS